MGRKGSCSSQSNQQLSKVNGIPRVIWITGYDNMKNSVTFLELMDWIFHNKRLYICCCFDNSEISVIKVYVKWRVIVGKGEKPVEEEERGRDWAHMYVTIRVPWCHRICRYGRRMCVLLSSSLPHLFYNLSLLFTSIEYMMCILGIPKDENLF